MLTQIELIKLDRNAFGSDHLCPELSVAIDQFSIKSNVTYRITIHKQNCKNSQGTRTLDRMNLDMIVNLDRKQELPAVAIS